MPQIASQHPVANVSSACEVAVVAMAILLKKKNDFFLRLLLLQPTALVRTPC
jgi:hypothetical protein